MGFLASSHFVLMLLYCAGSCDGSAFLSHPQGDGQEISIKDLEETLLTELFSVEKENHINQFKEELRPMYTALPKGEHGRLDPSTVRYALHRFFVQKYGWHMNGLDGASSGANSTSKESILKERAPTYIQSLFEREQAKGLGLHQLAVFAATLSDLAHNEAAVLLNTIFAALELPLTGTVDRESSEAAVKAYLISYLLNGVTGKTLNHLKFLETELKKVYPSWQETFLWTSDLRQAYDMRQRATQNPFLQEGHNFEKTVAFVQEVGHKLGTYQNLECHALKSKLVDMEFQGTGRVRLSQFYAAGLADVDWQFAESVAYLRHIGALDETDVKYPAVVIPNYVSGSSNCLLSSSFYSVCCMNECESLYESIERHFSGPNAEPSQIAFLVSHLPSETVSAPRNLSASLLSRLDTIAERHGGLVPLHGRLFAQWMHHVYPRECAFPNPGGDAQPLTPSQWLKETGSRYVASEEEMKIYANSTQDEQVDREADGIPWFHEERLLNSDISVRATSSQLRFGARFVIAVAAVTSLSVSLVWSARSAVPHVDDKADKFLV